MKRRTLLQYLGRSSAALAFTSLLLLGMPRLERSARAADSVLFVFVAKDSPWRDVSKVELKRLFSGESENIDGDHAIPFNQTPHTADRIQFDKQVLGMDPDQVGQYWIDRRIRGLSGPPRSVDSVGLLLRLVARLPGAVGYARGTQLPAELRALKIDGKAPGDPGYSLGR